MAPRWALVLWVVLNASAFQAGQRPKKMPDRHDDSGDVAFWGHGAETVASFGSNERYFGVLEAGDGAVWLTSRDDESPPRLRARHTLLRTNGTASALAGGDPLLFVDSKSAGHNMCAAFWRDELVAFGGQDQDTTRHYPWGVGIVGLRRSRSEVAAAAPYRMEAPVVLRGTHDGCIERRSGLQKICEFDGKLSVVAPHRGRVLLYARANTQPRGGARFLQVASAPESAPFLDSEDAWGPFELVHIQGYDATVSTNNIYFGAINANPADPGSVIGAFPVSLAGKTAFVAVAVSCDGVHFSRLERVLKSTTSEGGRTTDHPVDGLVLRDGDVSLYVHRDVPLISRGHSRIVRLRMPLGALANYTNVAKRTLPGCAGAD